MTTPHPQPPTEPMIGLHLDEADDLARLLGQLEDWLQHAGNDTVDLLAGFFNGPGHGALAAAGLIDLIGRHAARLHRQVKEATP
jgi:hypothetical protein